MAIFSKQDDEVTDKLKELSVSLSEVEKIEMNTSQISEIKKEESYVKGKKQAKANKKNKLF